MTNRTLLISFILLLLFFVRCDNEDSMDMTETPLNKSTCLLTKYSVFSKTSSGTDSFSLTQTFTFDYFDDMLFVLNNSLGFRNEYKYSNDLVTRITQLDDSTTEDLISEFVYDSENRIIRQIHGSFDGNEYNLIFEAVYTYDNDLLVQTQLENTDERYEFQYNSSTNYISSISKFDQNNRLLEIRTIDWDGKNNPFINLNVPAPGFDLLPTYYEQNILKITVQKFDEDGNPIFNPINIDNEREIIYNDYDFPSQIEFGINRIVYEYIDCE